jgi:aminoglycoside 3-N-acetyltransferase I
MPTQTRNYRIARLLATNVPVATRLFSTMADVFNEKHDRLSDEYVAQLLARDELWVLAATLGEEIVGGLTAHTLPMTRCESREIFIYDIAVRANHQRRGVGRLLVAHLTRIAGAAGIHDLFVAADDEDAHALDFYRALGGVASPVTVFTFGRESGETVRPPG